MTPPDDRPKSLPGTPMTRDDVLRKVVETNTDLALGLSQSEVRAAEWRSTQVGVMRGVAADVEQIKNELRSMRRGGKAKAGAIEVESENDERGDELSDRFEIPFTGGKDFAQLSRKTQRKVVRWLLLGIVFVATHFAHFVFAHISFEHQEEQDREQVHWIQGAKPMLPAPQLHLDAGAAHAPVELTK